MGDKIVLRSTRGVGQEVEFELIEKAEGTAVRSSLKVEGHLPRTGPSLLTPVSSAVARQWLNSQTERLRRNPAKFEEAKPALPSAMATCSISILSDPVLLLESLLAQEISQNLHEENYS